MPNGHTGDRRKQIAALRRIVDTKDVLSWQRGDPLPLTDQERHLIRYINRCLRHIAEQSRSIVKLAKLLNQADIAVTEMRR